MRVWALGLRGWGLGLRVRVENFLGLGVEDLMLRVGGLPGPQKAGLQKQGYLSCIIVRVLYIGVSTTRQVPI